MSEEFHKDGLVRERDESVQNLSPNYFARHWRGEHSLGVSFWVNGIVFGAVIWVMFSIVFGLVVYTAATSLPESGGTADVEANAFVMGATLGFYFQFFYGFFLMWHTTGLLRSASRHIAETGRVFFAFLTKIYCLLFFLICGSMIIWSAIVILTYFASGTFLPTQVLEGNASPAL